jgi:selenocysteine lyase/cysteine desulfurase
VLREPHSENPTSAASTALIERTRRSVLDYFSASEDEYAVIFTPIRASVGLASTIEDVERFLTLLETTYRDAQPLGDLGDVRSRLAGPRADALV